MSQFGVIHIEHNDNVFIGVSYFDYGNKGKYIKTDPNGNVLNRAPDFDATYFAHQGITSIVSLPSGVVYVGGRYTYTVDLHPGTDTLFFTATEGEEIAQIGCALLSSTNAPSLFSAFNDTSNVFASVNSRIGFTLLVGANSAS